MVKFCMHCISYLALCLMLNLIFVAYVSAHSLKSLESHQLGISSDIGYYFDDKIDGGLYFNYRWGLYNIISLELNSQLGYTFGSNCIYTKAGADFFFLFFGLGLGPILSIETTEKQYALDPGLYIEFIVFYPSPYDITFYLSPGWNIYFLNKSLMFYVQFSLLYQLFVE